MTTQFKLDIPARMPLLSRRGWSALVLVSLIVCIGAPVCALLVPESSPLHLSAYALTLIGKIMCYALAALALDLVWGYCGILSLGHGVFFALGGYAMGMYLMRSIGREDLITDPHLSATEFWQTHAHPTEGTLRLPANPLEMSDSPPSIRRLPPRLGEHTAEVLHAFGLAAVAPGG